MNFSNFRYVWMRLRKIYTCSRVDTAENTYSSAQERVVLGPPSVLLNGYGELLSWGYSGRGLKLVLRLRMSGALLALTLMTSWYANGKNIKNLLLFPRLCICLVDSVLLVLFKTFYYVYLHRVSSKENGLLFLSGVVLPPSKSLSRTVTICFA